MAMHGHHWRSKRKEARAFRSPRRAGVLWSVVARRITRELPKLTDIDDIYPLRDGIEEAAACLHIGGSKDIQTDIYTISTEEVAGDALHRSHSESGRTSAVSPAIRHHIISAYRYQKISAANRQLVSEVSSGLSFNRAFKVTFDTIVLAIDPTDSDKPGRMHADHI